MIPCLKRNLQEQVLKNAKDIAKLQEGGVETPVKSVNGKTGNVILDATDIRTTDQQTVQANIIRINKRIDDLDDEVEGKQDQLTAGENITIVDNVISATGGSGDLDPETLMDVLEGSNTVVVDLNEDESKVVVKLDEAVTTDIDTALGKVAQAEVNIEEMQGQIATLQEEVGDLDTGKLDASKSAVASVGGLVIPNSAPAADKLVGIDTASGQELITIGDGLSIEDGVLSADGGGGGESDLVIINWSDRTQYTVQSLFELQKAGKCVILYIPVSASMGECTAFMMTSVTNTGIYDDIAGGKADFIRMSGTEINQIQGRRLHGNGAWTTISNRLVIQVNSRKAVSDGSVTIYGTNIEKTSNDQRTVSEAIDEVNDKIDTLLPEYTEEDVGKVLSIDYNGHLYWADPGTPPEPPTGYQVVIDGTGTYEAGSDTATLQLIDDNENTLFENYFYGETELPDHTEDYVSYIRFYYDNDAGYDLYINGDQISSDYYDSGSYTYTIPVEDAITITSIRVDY